MSREPTVAGDEQGGSDPLPGASADATELDGDLADGELARLNRRRGESIGRYVLLEPIGHGGMGVVYSAYDPELDRRIALKLLRSEGGERGPARLVREAQAMAKLIHSNVITVHDVGSFERGVFVAMELVEGSDLRQWLAAARRPWPEIVEMFIKAGRGLHAAHQAGLVHRDFKPANVLVGKHGEVKVVDFGLARQLDTSLDTSELRALASELDKSGPLSDSINEGVTKTGALMGTPAYMAPEQHARRDLDARTDQFSFCVALYEALFGQRPFEGTSRVALAMATNRGELRPPPKGSSVPAPIARAVMRGLSTKPRDRFPSMAELLDELSYDPTRHQTQIVVGVAAVALLAVGVYGYVRETEPEEPVCGQGDQQLAGVWDEQQRATLHEAFAASTLPYAADSSRFVARRLDEWTEGWTRAQHEACEATHVFHTQSEDRLALRMQCLDRQRKDLRAVTRLLVEADAKAIERADRLLGSLPAPEACADIEALGRISPPADDSTRAAVESVRDRLSELRALRDVGRIDEGLDIALDTRDRADLSGYRPVIAEALEVLGSLQDRAGRHAEAEQTQHLAARTAAEARHDEVLVGTWLDLAWNIGIGQSRHEEAMRWAQYAEAIVNRLGRPDKLRTNLLCTQGNLAWAMRDDETALARLQACLELRERLMPGDPLIANTLSYIGNTQIDLGNYDAAEEAFRRGLKIATATQGAEHPLVASMHNGLGVTAYHQHRLADAERQYQRAYEINVKILGPDDPDLLYALGNIANCRRERGDYAAALAGMRRVEELVRKGFPPEHREAGTTKHNIAELLALQGQPEEALAYYDRALEIRTVVHGPDDPYVANTLTGRGEVLMSLDRTEEALEALERALAIREQARDPAVIDFGRTRFDLATALTRLGRDPARARALVEAARRDYEVADGVLQQARRAEMDAWLAEHPGR